MRGASVGCSHGRTVIATIIKTMKDKRSPGRKLLAFALVLVLAAAFAGVTYKTPSANVTLPIKELRLFSDIYARIKNNYVEEVADQKLLEGAINGMLRELDPYSVYLKERSYQDLKIGTSGKFGGLGIEVDMDDDFVKVIAPIDDTPAQRAGIIAGDRIAKIDDKLVKGMTLSEAVDLMRGEVGTQITLTLLRDNVAEPLIIELTRAVIKIKSARATLLEPDFAYVRLSKFQERTAQDLLAMLEKLAADNKRPLRGLILDLRSNPGGVLGEAVGVADVFLDEQNLIVYTKGRNHNAAVEYKATTPDRLNGTSLVVLIDQGSASASEIVAGALQDLKRATIMGANSFGKGSVQSIHQLDQGSALKLTTAKYYTPSGRTIHEVGIKPDLELAPLELSDEDKEARSKISRSDLKEWLAYDAQVNVALDKLKLIAATPQ